jgi:hypothetical protein
VEFARLQARSVTAHKRRAKRAVHWLAKAGAVTLVFVLFFWNPKTTEGFFWWFGLLIGLIATIAIAANFHDPK